MIHWSKCTLKPTIKHSEPIRRQTTNPLDSLCSHSLPQLLVHFFGITLYAQIKANTAITITAVDKSLKVITFILLCI